MLKNPPQNTPFLLNTTLNCGGRLMDLSTPKVMGIINVTPDSFHPHDQKHLVRNGEVDLSLTISIAGNMIEAGADILDIGGASSRPGADKSKPDLETERVIPVFSALSNEFPDMILSIDSYHSTVVRAAVEHGATMVNDISAGLFDRAMFETAGELNVPYVLMHMQGTPNNMQDDPTYENVTLEIMDFFLDRLIQLRQAGVADILIDPGFGFGKTVDHNYELLRNMNYFKALNLPILIGISRKSMINKVLHSLPENALNGTSALHMLALTKGARVLRVHDVKEAKEVINLWSKYDAAI